MSKPKLHQRKPYPWHTIFLRLTMVVSSNSNLVWNFSLMMAHKETNCHRSCWQWRSQIVLSFLWVYATMKIARLCNTSSSDGTLPLNRFDEMSKLFMFSWFEKRLGMGPVSWLWDKFIACIWLNNPSSFGISPIRLLQDKSIPDM